MNWIREKYLKTAYSASTGHILNYFTLKISDKEIEEKVRVRVYTQFNNIIWPCFIMNSCSLIYHLLNWSIGNGSVVMVVIAVLQFLNQIVIMILRCTSPSNTTRCIWSYMLIHVVITNIVYYNKEGDAFYVEDKSPYDIQIIVNFVLVNSVQFNSLKFTLFLQLPTFFIGIIF